MKSFVFIYFILIFIYRTVKIGFRQPKYINIMFINEVFNVLEFLFSFTWFPEMAASPIPMSNINAGFVTIGSFYVGVPASCQEFRM